VHVPPVETGLNVAVTVSLELMVTSQALPEQAPPNPLKLDPVADWFCR
jgi:hypothetical protein